MPRRFFVLLLAVPGCAPGDAAGSAPPASATPHASASPPPSASAPTAIATPSADAGAGGVSDAGGDRDGDDGGDGTTPDAPCPADMALVGRFCVDRYEAHLVVDPELTLHPHWERPAPGIRYIARSAPDVFPQAYISRVEAKAACEAAGKRLCTRREWMRACRGKGVQRYPYGGRGKRGRCNTGKTHLLSELFGEHPRGGWSYEDHFNSPELDQKPGFLAKAGTYEGCVSELGIHDMVGNLHEWVRDTVDQHFMDRLAEENAERRDQPWHEGNGVFMGGFFSTTSELGPGCYYTTVAHEPKYHDYSTGFRCCADAHPPAVSSPKR